MIDKKTIAELLKLVISEGESEDKVDEGVTFKVYQFHEIQVSFSITDKQRFFGMVFIYFGSEMIISNDFMLLAYEQDTGEGIVIEDDEFVKLVNEYLALRVRSLRDFNY